MQHIILHIDMNSYFASVEQQANPFLRGKPLGVCAYLSERGCIIASSKEAKALGIGVGVRVFEAKKICPQMIFVENDPKKYRSVTSRIFKILAEYTDTMEPYSIDEAFLDLTGWVKDLKQAEDLGIEMNRRIKQEVGEWLTSSVGIAETKFLAKFASDNAAKDSILVIPQAKRQKYLGRVKLTDCWGINKALERRLNWLGIHTPLELATYPVSNLMNALGKIGYFLWANMNGIEYDRVKSENETTPKSIGHSYCLPRPSVNWADLAPVFMKLCEKTGRRLRALGKEATGISVGAAYTVEGGVHKSLQLKSILYTSQDIYQAASSLLQKNLQPYQVVRFLAVSVYNLQPISQQQSLFVELQKKKDLNFSLDQVNDKYGEYTVFFGEQWGSETNVLDRIGFRKTVSWQSEI